MSPHAREVLRHLTDWSLHRPRDTGEAHWLAECIACALIFAVLYLLLVLVMGIDDGTTFYR